MHREPRTATPVETPTRPTSRRSAQPPSSRRGAPPRHHSKRVEREEHYQRLALIVAGAIVAIVLLLLGAGWIQSYILPYRKTVITVGGRHASMDFLIKRANEVAPEISVQNQPTSSGQEQQIVAEAAARAATGQIEDEFLVLQAAPRQNITVTEQQVDAEIASDLGVAPAGATPPRTTLESALSAQLGKTGLTLAQYREGTRAKLLASAIQDKLRADYPKTAPEAKYEELIINDKASAQKLVDRLKNGESWETLWAEVQKNASSGTGKQFDFQLKQQVDPSDQGDAVANALFALEPNGSTDVVQTGNGKYVVARLIEKDDNHAVGDDQVQAITAKLYQNWLNEQQKTFAVKENLSTAQMNFAKAHVTYTSPPVGQKPGSPQQNVAVPAQPPAQFNPANLPPGISTPVGGFGSGAVPSTSGTQGP